MNIFRFFGDLSHLASIFILLFAIEKNKSTAGLSMKTQLLYVLIYVTRYLNLFTKYYSLYNSLLKIFFIGSSIYTVYIMGTKYRKTIQEDIDTFPFKYLVLGSAISALVFCHKYTFREVMWSFSIWLRLWLFFLSCTFCKEPARLKTSPPTISSPWEYIEPCIFQTGSTGTLSRAISTIFQYWRGLFKLSYTQISSIFIITRS